MQYTIKYNSPLGEILIATDEMGITGLWFENQKYFAYGLEENNVIGADIIPNVVAESFSQVKSWLDIYFSRENPDFTPPIHFLGTDFQKEVWEILTKIPYGKTTTYGEIAKLIAEKRGLEKMSARAVGGAVGRNPISIIVPCHRVIGTNGKLTGYAGGIERKIELLKIENTFAYL